MLQQIVAGTVGDMQGYGKCTGTLWGVILGFENEMFIQWLL